MQFFRSSLQKRKELLKKCKRTAFEKIEEQPENHSAPKGPTEASIAALDEVEEAGFDVFTLFDEGHVGHVGEEESLGAARQEGLGDSELDGYAGVVLAVDEVEGDVELLQHVEPRGALGHAALGGDDGGGGGFEALVAEVFDVVREGRAAAVVEERGDEAYNVGGAVLLHSLAHLFAAHAVFGSVGQGVRVDETHPFDGVGVAIGEGQRDIAAHGVAHHDTLVDAGGVEDFLDDAGHEVHGVDVAEGVGEAMSREVDGDDTQTVHVAQDIGTPHVEVLQESMQKHYGVGVAASLVTIVHGAAVDSQCAVLFHLFSSLQFTVYGLRFRCLRQLL